MTEGIKSKIWLFNDNVNTDQILPSQYLLMNSVDQMKQYAFEPIEKDFSKLACEGDIIVAGNNFGCGSSREQAPMVLKALGIKAIIACSFAMIFFRNAINIGLPVLICDELNNNVKTGDILEADVRNGIIKFNNKSFSCAKLPENIMNILDAGGLINYVNNAVK